LDLDLVLNHRLFPVQHARVFLVALNLHAMISVHKARMHAVPVHPIAAAAVTAASAPAQVPAKAAITNTNGHAAGQPYGSMYEACLAMRDKVDAFLAEEPTAPLLRRVQEQVRISVQVTEEALERYRYVLLLAQYCAEVLAGLADTDARIQAGRDLHLIQWRQRLYVLIEERSRACALQLRVCASETSCIMRPAMALSPACMC
jgi:hypothetical protein